MITVTLYCMRFVQRKRCHLTTCVEACAKGKSIVELTVIDLPLPVHCGFLLVATCNIHACRGRAEKYLRNEDI